MLRADRSRGSTNPDPARVFTTNLVGLPGTPSHFDHTGGTNCVCVRICTSEYGKGKNTTTVTNARHVSLPCRPRRFSDGVRILVG